MSCWICGRGYCSELEPARLEKRAQFLLKSPQIAFARPVTSAVWVDAEPTRLIKEPRRGHSVTESDSPVDKRAWFFKSVQLDGHTPSHFTGCSTGSRFFGWRKPCHINRSGRRNAAVLERDTVVERQQTNLHEGQRQSEFIIDPLLKFPKRAAFIGPPGNHFLLAFVKFHGDSALPLIVSPYILRPFRHTKINCSDGTTRFKRSETNRMQSDCHNQMRSRYPIPLSSNRLTIAAFQAMRHYRRTRSGGQDRNLRHSKADQGTRYPRSRLKAFSI